MAWDNLLSAFNRSILFLLENIIHLFTQGPVDKESHPHFSFASQDIPVMSKKVINQLLLTPSIANSHPKLYFFAPSHPPTQDTALPWFWYIGPQSITSVNSIAILFIPYFFTKQNIVLFCGFYFYNWCYIAFTFLNLLLHVHFMLIGLPISTPSIET